ncbi:hypothetical protein Y032_0086g1958 [Ancylostoma ceylanicum]|uniref:Uncharacterized protein n=1 Tax=Ancylostoma ceylanicum TaxID=53326 RepID=A0A016TQK1_9BILA|nr:hypothetical protein Y032_0086g1958 [Ancylostoma ceylanicum]
MAEFPISVWVDNVAFSPSGCGPAHDSFISFVDVNQINFDCSNPKQFSTSCHGPLIDLHITCIAFKFNCISSTCV